MLTNQVRGVRTSYALGGTRALQAIVGVRYANLQRILKFHLFQFPNCIYSGNLSHLSFLVTLYKLQPTQIQSFSTLSPWHAYYL